MAGGYRFDSAVLTHEGRIRTNNEDAYCSRGGDGVWMVADGMGGHEHGEWASAAIASAFSSARVRSDHMDAVAAIAQGIHQANHVVWTESEARGQQMGSTVVALSIQDDRFAVLWVGDSRAYLLRRGSLHQLTKDHTQVQEMIDRGLLSEADAVDHPMGHVLARAVGVRPDVEVDVIEDLVEPGDVFLLCSDGLTGPVDDAEIGRILASGDPQAAVRQLVDRTLDNGAPDNVTVIVVAANETTLRSMPDSADTVFP